MLLFSLFILSNPVEMLISSFFGIFFPSLLISPLKMIFFLHTAPFFHLHREWADDWALKQLSVKEQLVMWNCPSFTPALLLMMMSLLWTICTLGAVSISFCSVFKVVTPTEWSWCGWFNTVDSVTPGWIHYLNGSEVPSDCCNLLKHAGDIQINDIDFGN